ncbi:hypothetical protein PI125_g21490 [Phytophthora idaei]|nr:hypothetical protein PI125_g21490 [Phytophthora idaei]
MSHGSTGGRRPTKFAPSGALKSHEPTSARKQKRFWRGHEAESAMVLDIGTSELVSNEVAVVHERGSQDVSGAAQHPQSGAGLFSDPLLCPDEDERGVARNPLSGVSRVNDSPQRCTSGTPDRRTRHHGRNPGDADGVAPIPLSEGHGPHGSER